MSCSTRIIPIIYAVGTLGLASAAAYRLMEFFVVVPHSSFSPRPTRVFAGNNIMRDTHFSLSWPLVADLFDVAAKDWRFATSGLLKGKAWRMETLEQAGDLVVIHALASGPI